MYKISELRVKSREELLKLISELKGKLLALRFESATGQLKETHLPSATKKDIALIFTVLKEQELGIVVKEKPVEEKQVAKENVSVEKEDKKETKDEPKAKEEKVVQSKPEETKTSKTKEDKKETSEGDSK